MPDLNHPTSTLIVDTSGAWSTVVVASGSRVLGVTSVRARSSEHLHNIADTLLQMLGIRLATLRNIAVVIGPGSWTGLHIGVSAAKVLGQVLDIPVIPVSSLDVLAAGCKSATDATCALLDAGRKRVYYRWYTPTMTKNGPRVASISDWKESLSRYPATITVIEYGDVWFSELVQHLPHGCLHKQERLLPEALASVAADNPGVSGSKRQALTPHYVQASLFERDLS